VKNWFPQYSICEKLVSTGFYWFLTPLLSNATCTAYSAAVEQLVIPHQEPVELLPRDACLLAMQVCASAARSSYSSPTL
jgi:hypothetical protein